MNKTIALLGAPSNIGIRPYDDGRLRGLDRAPAALRARGLAARLHADDVGDVVPPEYVDFTRPAGRVRNEAALVALFEGHRRAGGGCRARMSVSCFSSGAIAASSWAAC